MLEDQNTPLDDSGPLPYDTITLHPGNSAGAPAAEVYVLADFAPAPAGGQAWEINHPDSHPRYWDWAATVTTSDIALITRMTPAGPVSWAPIR
ncbi:hypothetical protein EDD99_8116 [Streptomyces sp. 846.5]|nr:DUF6211 family protein [Streptomyces sp. 846.5]TDT93307.1 hypothetical protein EDD99_8116 [Streptomyces sp. 846.5]